MRTRATLTPILERMYAPEIDEQAWLAGIRSAAEAAVEGQAFVQCYTAELTPDGRVTFGNIAGEEWANELMLRCHQAVADPNAVRKLYEALYLSGPIASAARAIRLSEVDSLREAFQLGTQMSGLTDVTSAVGTDPGGRICVLAFGRRGGRLPISIRTVLSRISGHLASANRLRGRPEEDVEAVLDPNGKLLHARDGKLADAHGPSLRQAALAIDRARRMGPADPERGLAAWKAMVEGRWTLVERFESDGRRIFLGRPNAPSTRKLRALTEGERKIVAMAVLCHPAKLIAYELGLAESTVSEQLASALEKLGVRTRAELVEVHGAVAGHGDPRRRAK